MPLVVRLRLNLAYLLPYLLLMTCSVVVVAEGIFVAGRLGALMPGVVVAVLGSVGLALFSYPVVATLLRVPLITISDGGGSAYR